VYDEGAIRVVGIGLAGGFLVTAEENKRAFRRTYDELLNQGNLAVADEVISPDFVNHEAPPGHNQGPESMRALAGMLRTAFPDLRFTIEELITEGDLVAGRLTMRGTHEGPLMGMPPTGRSVEQAHMHFVRFQDGKAVEHWGVRDDVGMLRQLGLMPEPRGDGPPSSGA
jgi:predicted ester cyclase